MTKTMQLLVIQIKKSIFFRIKSHLYFITENIVNLVFSYYPRKQFCISRVEWFMSVGTINGILKCVDQCTQKGGFPCLWSKSPIGKIKKCDFG